MMLALAAGQLRAQTETAYAVYCENSKELHFLCNDNANLSSVEIGGVKVNLTFEGDNTNAWKGEAVTNTKDYSAPGWESIRSEATKVVFEPSFANAVVTSCYKWFDNFIGLTTVTGLEYLKISETSSETETSNTSAGSMFSHCSALTSLDLSKFDTSNVTNMSSMFLCCSALTSLDLSGSFNTSNVTNMNSMFEGCNKLTSLDLSNFGNSYNLSSVNNMFKDCRALKFLDLLNAAKDKIPNMIETLPDNASPVIFVPSGTTLTGNRKNVIIGEKCDDLEIDADDLTSLNFPYSFKANKITFRRNFTADKPHTLYLPFAIDAKKYGTFYTLTEYDNANQKVVFSKIKDNNGMTTANTPYLFVPNETTYSIVIDGGNIEVKATTEVEVTEQTEGLIGVYKKHTFDDTNKANCYGWADDKFMRAGSGASVGACRAYLKLAADGGSLAPARLSISLDGDGTTGITAVKGGADGDSDAPMYNLQGQRVDKSYRGVVIKNGKKMIIK